MSDEHQTQNDSEAPTPGSETETTAAEAATPEARIAELEAKYSEKNDQLLRTLAEMENIRKRADRQVADAHVYAIERFARDLLSVSDNMTRALDALDEEARSSLSEQGKNLLEGVEMTQKELHAALSRNHVTPIVAEPGAAFDPNLHEAVTSIPSDAPAGSVAAVFQSGWKIKDRTLRAAMVAVSLGGGQPGGEGQA